MARGGQTVRDDILMITESIRDDPVFWSGQAAGQFRERGGPRDTVCGEEGSLRGGANDQRGHAGQRGGGRQPRPPPLHLRHLDGGEQGYRQDTIPKRRRLKS